MKIIKTQEQANKLKIGKEIANRGCNVCPCCGEKYGSKGLRIPTCRTWCTGFFKTKHYKVDTYSCDSCGAVWESEPYEY